MSHLDIRREKYTNHCCERKAAHYSRGLCLITISHHTWHTNSARAEQKHTKTLKDVQSSCHNPASWYPIAAEEENNKKENTHALEKYQVKYMQLIRNFRCSFHNFSFLFSHLPLPCP